MSSMYYIGTIKNNIVNIPIDISGITQNCIEDILKYCNIDIYEDFNYFSSEAFNNLLFYKIKKENLESISENNFLDEDYFKEEVEYSEYPVSCNDDIIKNGSLYYLNKRNLIKPNYKNFKDIDLTINLLDYILKDYSGWTNNRDKDFFERIKEHFQTITKWIKDNETIYWWKYI